MPVTPSLSWALVVALATLLAVAVVASRLGRGLLAAETTVVVVSQRLIADGRILPHDVPPRSGHSSLRPDARQSGVPVAVHTGPPVEATPEKPDARP
jgi:hypothetical protein